MTEAALNALVLFFPDAQIVLIGDSKQLPPFMYQPGDVVSELAAHSALDVLKQKGNVPIVRLVEVYRAAPSLIRHYSEVFYDGELVSGKPETKELDLSGISPKVGNRCLFVKVAGTTKQVGTSKTNKAEVAALKDLLSRIRLRFDQRQVMIICYYEAQCAYVKKELGEYEVHTVDSAQGREADIVFVLTTRTKASAAQFFTCPLRANVAMSRHKEALIVLGSDALQQMQPWLQLLDEKYFPSIDYASIRA